MYNFTSARFNTNDANSRVTLFDSNGNRIAGVSQNYQPLVDWVNQGNTIQPYMWLSGDLALAKEERKMEALTEQRKRNAGIVPKEEIDYLQGTAAVLARKESKGTATADEIAQLDALEAKMALIQVVKGKYDVLILWIDDAVRTFAEIEALDVTLDSHWI